MKKVGIIMSLLMGVTMSFCLSLTGILSSGQKFDLKQFLISFGASTAISIIIGVIVPMRKLEGGAVKTLKLREGSIPARLVSAFVSDLIYTPVITFAMILLVRKMVMDESHGKAKLPPFSEMFTESLIISFIVAFFIILIITPVYMKLSFKLAGVKKP